MHLTKWCFFFAGVMGLSLVDSALVAADSPPTPPGLVARPSPTIAAPPLPAPSVPAPAVPNLVWDSELKEYSAKPGEMLASFVFHLTNVSPVEIIINSAQGSCGCTVAKLPTLPWHLASGSNGEMQVSVNLQGKLGTITKQVTANTSVGMKQVSVRVIIPPPVAMAKLSEADRQRNMQMSEGDRQAVFRGDCASCHVKPAQGKMGADLFVAACGVCHESPNRAAKVPDLHALKFRTNVDYWRHWIHNGRPGSMMPAFGMDQGGPLSDAQIASLSDYLEKTISHSIGPAPMAPLPPPRKLPQPTITNAAVTPSGRVIALPPTHQ